MSSITKLYDTLVITILGGWLLIDTLNGYLINNSIYFVGSVSFGEILRIFFLGLLLVSFKAKVKDLFFLFVPYFLIVLILVQYLVFSSDIIRNLNIVVKLSLPILLFVFFKNRKIFLKNRRYILNIIYINSGILLGNLYISYFGFGFKNYGNVLNLGGTGFFYAGNEVSGLLLVLYSLLVFIFRHEIKKVLLFSFLYLIAALALTSKAAIFGVLIILMIYIYIYKPIAKFKIAILILSGSFLIYNFIYDYIIIAINRWDFFIENYGAVTYLTGGSKRWEVVSEYLIKFKNEPFLLLVGDGWSGVAEQNFIDLLEAYGIIGILVYLLWIYWAFNIHKKLKGGKEGKYALFVFFVILSIATLAGHIIQSAMIAPFIAILANLDIIKNEHRLRFS